MLGWVSSLARSFQTFQEHIWKPDTDLAVLSRGLLSECFWGLRVETDSGLQHRHCTAHVTLKELASFKMNSKYFKGRPSRVESCAKTKQVAERIGLLHSFTMFHDSWRFMAPLFLGWQSSHWSFCFFVRAFDRTINLSRASGLIVTFSCQAWMSQNLSKSKTVD